MNKLPVTPKDYANAVINLEGGGIYIHIPFCKQACHYCDFHFSTSSKHKTALIEMLCRELVLRKNELGTTKINTIYFGGGTPSLLNASELQLLFDTIHGNYSVSKDAEVTLEANPDDLGLKKLEELKASKINRLSIGVQSFFEEDLVMMNRAHNSKEALDSIKMAKKYFNNISIDLIYGIPGMTNERWEENIDIAINLGLVHFSCYALTVEPNTALKKFIDSGRVRPVDDEVSSEHFNILLQKLKAEGFIHYEFSNFGKPGFFSQNNTSYWMGKPYLGIGPSAHSYDGNLRKWNVSNNVQYIKALQNDDLPLEEEVLSIADRYNEYIMTRLRTMWGISLLEIESNFGLKYRHYLENQMTPLLKNGLIIVDGKNIRVSAKGKFLSDGIASDLFFLNLD